GGSRRALDGCLVRNRGVGGETRIDKRKSRKFGRRRSGEGPWSRQGVGKSAAPASSGSGNAYGLIVGCRVRGVALVEVKVSRHCRCSRQSMVGLRVGAGH